MAYYNTVLTPAQIESVYTLASHPSAYSPIMLIDYNQPVSAYYYPEVNFHNHKFTVSGVPELDGGNCH
jgi:hypothetical protein